MEKHRLRAWRRIAYRRFFVAAHALDTNTGELTGDPNDIHWLEWEKAKQLVFTFGLNPLKIINQVRRIRIKERKNANSRTNR